MSGWVLVAVWAAGWVLAVRPSMRRTMLQEVCSKCEGRLWCDCKNAPRVVRGSQFERDGGDVAWSLWIAAWWPVWLWIVCTRITLRGLSAAVIRATPLTGPELERRIAEQQAEIARLTEQIDDTHHDAGRKDAWKRRHR